MNHSRQSTAKMYKRAQNGVLAVLLALAMVFSFIPVIDQAYAINNGAGTKSCNFNGYTIKDNKTFIWLMDRNISSPIQPRIYDVTYPDNPEQLTDISIAKNSVTRDWFYPVGGGDFVPGGSTVSSTGNIAYTLTDGSTFQAGHTYRVEISPDNKSNNGIVLGLTTANKPIIIHFTMPDELVTYDAGNQTNLFDSTYSAIAEPVIDTFVEDGDTNVPLARMPYINTSIPIESIIDADGNEIAMPRGMTSGSDFTLPEEALDDLYFSADGKSLRVWTTANDIDTSSPGYAQYNTDAVLYQDLVRPSIITPGTNISWPFAGSGSAAPDFNWMPGTTYTLHIPAMKFVNDRVSEPRTVTFTTCGEKYEGDSFTTNAELKAYQAMNDNAYPMHALAAPAVSGQTVTWLAAAPDDEKFSAPDGYNLYISKDQYYDYHKLNNELIDPKNRSFNIPNKYGDGTTYYVRVAGNANGADGSWTPYASVNFAAAAYNAKFDIGEGVAGIAPADIEAIDGIDFTLPSADGFSKEGYSFVGWNDGTSTYPAGDTYVMPLNGITFTAQWTKEGSAEFAGTTYVDAYTARDKGFTIKIKLTGASTSLDRINENKAAFADKITVESATNLTNSGSYTMKMASAGDTAAYRADCEKIKNAIADGTYTVSEEGTLITINCDPIEDLQGYMAFTQGNAGASFAFNYDYKIGMTLPKAILTNQAYDLEITNKFTVQEMKASIEIVDKDGNPSILTEYDIKNGTGKKIRLLLNGGGTANKYLQYPTKFDTYHNRTFTTTLIGLDAYALDPTGIPGAPNVASPTGSTFAASNSAIAINEIANDHAEWKKIEAEWFAGKPAELNLLGTSVASTETTRNGVKTPQTASYAYGLGNDRATVLTIPKISDFEISEDMTIYAQLFYGFFGGTGGGLGPGGEFPFWGMDGRLCFTVYEGNGPAGQQVTDSNAPEFAASDSNLASYIYAKAITSPVNVAQDRPIIINKVADKFDLVVNVDETATVYYAVYDQIIDGISGADLINGRLDSLAKGSLAVTPNKDFLQTAETLPADKNWVLYTVAKDSAGNYSEVIQKKVQEAGDLATKCAISFDLNGGTGNTPDSIFANYGGSSPNLPDATGVTAPSGKRFKGWGIAADGSGTQFNAGTAIPDVTAALKLYALWEKAPSSSGGGSTAKKIPSKWVNPFTDVSENAWYYNAVAFVSEKGLFNGTSSDKFSPNSSMTRAMFVTVLARLSGDDLSGYTNEFSDVPAGTWFNGSVSWASRKGIVNGISDDRFSPNSSITREQMAVMLYNYAKQSGINVSAIEGDALTNFNDGSSVSSWANTAMKWCIQKGYIAGKGNNTLDPKGIATRAEASKLFAIIEQL